MYCSSFSFIARIAVTCAYLYIFMLYVSFITIGGEGVTKVLPLIFCLYVEYSNTDIPECSIPSLLLYLHAHFLVFHLFLLRASFCRVNFFISFHCRQSALAGFSVSISLFQSTLWYACSLFMKQIHIYLLILLIILKLFSCPIASLLRLRTSWFQIVLHHVVHWHYFVNSLSIWFVASDMFDSELNVLNLAVCTIWFFYSNTIIVSRQSSSYIQMTSILFRNVTDSLHVWLWDFAYSCIQFIACIFFSF